MNPALTPTSQSDREIVEQNKNHNLLEEATGIIGNLPKLPPAVTAGSKVLEKNFKDAQEKGKRELQRRKKRR